MGTLVIVSPVKFVAFVEFTMTMSAGLFTLENISEDAGSLLGWESLCSNETLAMLISDVDDA